LRADLGYASGRPRPTVVSPSCAPNLTPPADFRATPLMIDGVFYGSNGVGFVEA
jgi:hypothetical protein